MAGIADIIDSITDNVGEIIAAVRGTPSPVLAQQQNNAALYMAQQQQQNKTLMILAVVGLGFFALTRK